MILGANPSLGAGPIDRLTIDAPKPIYRATALRMVVAIGLEPM